MVALVRSRKQHAERSFVSYFQRLGRWYDLYRGIYTAKFAAFRNNVHIPFTYSVIQSDVARKVQALFGSWPIVQFEGYPPEEEANAKRNELLVSAQMKDSRSYPKAVDFFTTADLYGVAIARHGWKRVVHREKYRVPEELGPGVTQERIHELDVVRFDGPDWSVVDPLDFFPQPGFKYIEEMDWAIQRYYLDLDTIREMERPHPHTGEPGYFEPGTAAKLAQAPMQSAAESEMQQRISVYRTWSDYSARREEKYAKPIEIWEMWGLVPKEFAPDGVRMRCVIVGNGRVLMKNKQNPYWHGEKPFKAFQVGDPHYFHGVGKAEILQKPQATVNRLMNHKLDALDLVISPMWAMNGSANINAQNLYTSPGKIIQMDGPVDDTNLRALSPDMRGLAEAYNGIQELWRYMQQGSGIVEDTVSGLPSSGRQTAREFQGRQENVASRLHLEAMIACEQWLEPMCNMFRALNRQYLPVPRMLTMIGSAAITNPNTGLPMPLEPTPIGPEDLYPDYKARAMGATNMTGINVRQQNTLQMMQAMSANPVLMQMVNWAVFAREMFQTFGFKNVNELIVQQMPALNTVADEMGVGPEQAAGMVSSPEQLNPAQISQLMGAA